MRKPSLYARGGVETDHFCLFIEITVFLHEPFSFLEPSNHSSTTVNNEMMAFRHLTLDCSHTTLNFKEITSIT